MTDFTFLLQQGGAHAWLFIPSAILLGALHGLEPGHSKTMMAAFIIAVRGTVRQAVLLGLAATLSHTAVVWLVALGGMWLFGGLRAEDTEPYFQLASGVIIVGLAIWMLWQMAQRWAGFGEIVRKAPYVSGTIILAVGAYVGFSGWIHLPAA